MGFLPLTPRQPGGPEGSAEQEVGTPSDYIEGGGLKLAPAHAPLGPGQEKTGSDISTPAPQNHSPGVRESPKAQNRDLAASEGSGWR